MDNENEFANPIAFVYLFRENDEKNKCLFTHEHLLIIKKGRKRIIHLSDIVSIGFSHKLLLLPLLLGGSFGPFFFISLLGGHFHPIISLTGFLLSILGLYIGFAGKKTFRVELKNDSYEIFLNAISDNLKEFVSFINEIVLGNDKDEILTFYLPLDRNMETELKNVGGIRLNEEGIFSETSKNFRLLKDRSTLRNKPYLKIHYKTPDIKIKFEKDADGKLKPKISGFISQENELVYL